MKLDVYLVTVSCSILLTVNVCTCALLYNNTIVLRNTSVHFCAYYSALHIVDICNKCLLNWIHIFCMLKRNMMHSQNSLGIKSFCLKYTHEMGF